MLIPYYIASEYPGSHTIESIRMTPNVHARPTAEDEYEYDFSDNRGHLILRWKETVESCEQRLTNADLQTIRNYDNVNKVGRFVRQRIVDGKPPLPSLTHISPVLQTLKHFLGLLSRAFPPDSMDSSLYPMDTSLLWGVLYLNILLSIESELKLSRIMESIIKIRRIMELLHHLIGDPGQDGETRLSMVEILVPLTLVLVDSITHLRRHPTETEAIKEWPQLKKKFENACTKIDEIVQHLRNIADVSRLAVENQMAHERRRNISGPGRDETGVFPCRRLPQGRNELFYGREDVIRKITRHLHWETSKFLRTFTIYGRRGVGKTHIALEYAYRNESGFDAIFWIACETSASLRQSFTDVALKLELPGAEATGNHEENLDRVHKWLKETDRHWLLIFDNAENGELLKNYWPVCKGAVLITSRKYENFNNDATRAGETVKLFNPSESWDILCKLVGWHTEGDEVVSTQTLLPVPDEEVEAAKTLVTKLEGLALGIEQLATMFKKSPDTTMKELLVLFEESAERLPPRWAIERSSVIKALESLWSIAFQDLTPNAKTLLGVLCLLEPDVIPMDLFLPKNQTALSRSLHFCRQNPGQAQASLSSVINPSPGLADAIKELVDKSLIRKEKRILSVHRVVQEAFMYFGGDEREDAFTSAELQDAFDSAVGLVYQAFPKQKNGRNLFPVWRRCQTYIQHGIILATRFNTPEFRNAKPAVKSAPMFVELLSNCCWYLYEVGDHSENLRVLEIAYSACAGEGILYAHLRNTAGLIYNEVNHLKKAQECLEKSLEIRESLLGGNHEEVGNVLNNLGVVMSAKGKNEKALEYFDRAEEIRKSQDTDEHESLLVVTYLTKARTLLLLNRIEEATSYLENVEAILMRTTGPNSIYMAHVHFMFGNLWRSQGNKNQAKRAYVLALKILNQETPTHVFTASTYYKLAGVEASLENFEGARRSIDRALTLANLRRSSSNDGNVARILWKKSRIMSTNPYASSEEVVEAEELKSKAAFMRRDVLVDQGLTHTVLEAVASDAEMEAAYDKLVCGFYR